MKRFPSEAGYDVVISTQEEFDAWVATPVSSKGDTSVLIRPLRDASYYTSLPFCIPCDCRIFAYGVSLLITVDSTFTAKFGAGFNDEDFEHIVQYTYYYAIGVSEWDYTYRISTRGCIKGLTLIVDSSLSRCIGFFNCVNLEDVTVIFDNTSGFASISGTLHIVGFNSCCFCHNCSVRHLAGNTHHFAGFRSCDSLIACRTIAPVSGSNCIGFLQCYSLVSCSYLYKMNHKFNKGFKFCTGLVACFSHYNDNLDYYSVSTTAANFSAGSSRIAACISTNGDPSGTLIDSDSCGW